MNLKGHNKLCSQKAIDRAEHPFTRNPPLLTRLKFSSAKLLKNPWLRY